MSRVEGFISRSAEGVAGPAIRPGDQALRRDTSRDDAGTQRGLSTIRAWRPSWLTAAIGGVMMMAIIPRVHNLGAPSLWYDEVKTLHGAMTLDVGFSKILGYLPNTAGLVIQGIGNRAQLAEHPERWRAAGIDEIATRLPSCILGIITVPLLFVLGCRVFGPGMSLVSAALLATSMWHVFESQNARFYTIQFLFYNVSLLLYLDWRRSGRRATAAGAFLCLLLSALSQPTAIVLLGVYGVDSLWRLADVGNRRGIVKVLVGLSIPAALFGAVIGIDIWRNPENWSQFFQKPNLPPFRLVFSGGYHIGPAIVLLALIGGWRALRRRDAMGRTLLLAAVLPLALYSLLALRARVELRYIFPCLYAWLALSVWTAADLIPELGSASRRAFAAIALVLVGGQLIPLYDYYNQNGYRPNTREAVAWVNQHRAAGDRIFMDLDEGPYYFGERLAGAPPSIDELAASEQSPAWVLYRTDERGTKPAPEPWTEHNTVLMNVFGHDSINRMARIYVRYWPGKTSRHAYPVAPRSASN